MNTRPVHDTNHAEILLGPGRVIHASTWQRQGGPLIVERGLIRVIRRPSCLCDPA